MRRPDFEKLSEDRRASGQRQTRVGRARVVICVLAGFVWFGALPGQAADPMPDSHAAHHPGGSGPEAPSPGMPSSPPAGAAGMNGMMDIMKGMMGPSPPPPPSGAPGQPAVTDGAMPTPSATPPPAMGAAGAGSPGASGMGGMATGGCCGGAGPKPFYAVLMTMPVLTPEARHFIEAEADRRLGTGAEQITIGQALLHHALAASDGAALQRAAAGVRQGLLLVESGASAQQAMSEGQPPPQIALTWFKGQASVPAAGTMTMGDGLWGLSWLHLLMMTFLVAFLVAALLIHFGRTRRVAGLVARLSVGTAAGPNASGKAALIAAAATAARPGAAPGLAANPQTAAPPNTPAASDAPKKLWSGMLRVADIFQETARVKTFRLTPVDQAAMPFTFLPGQFLSFSAGIDGKQIRRSYTIASSPSQRSYVELTVKREEQGIESRYLHDHVAVGNLLNVAGPSGVFTFTGKETESIVLIAGGVGVTPMMCIIRYLTDNAYRGDIFFLYGIQTTKDFIFREEIEYLRKRHPNLHVAITVSAPEEGSWNGATGFITKAFIKRSVPDIARRRVHLCGPPPMTEAVKAALAELGLHKEQIKTEAFAAAAPPPVVPPPTAPLEAQPTPATAAGAPGAPAPAAAVGQVMVQFSTSGKSGPLAPDKCVLEAAEAIGVAIDFVCRVGTCGTCVVPLASGTVTMAVEEGLPPDQKAKGIILACQAKSTGNLVVAA